MVIDLQMDIDEILARMHRLSDGEMNSLISIAKDFLDRLEAENGTRESPRPKSSWITPT